MQRGFFDLPGIVFDWIQSSLLDFFPALISVYLWALIAAFLSMKCYARFSNQGALQALKPEQQSARDQLANYDGPFDGLLPLIKQNLSLSLRHMRLTLIPALVGAIPILFILPWLSNTFGVEFPDAGAAVKVELQGEGLDALYWAPNAQVSTEESGRWLVSWPDAMQPIELKDAQGVVILSLPPDAPSPVMHKKYWWNILLANPAGYLAADGPLDWVILGFTERSLIAIGPGWFRTWLIHFLIGLLLFSLFFKWRWRLR